MANSVWSVLTFVCCLFLFPTEALAYRQPVPGQHIYDDAGYFRDRPRREALERELVSFEQGPAHTRIIVMTVPSLARETIDDYALGVLCEWGLSDRGRGNSVLILVARRGQGGRSQITIAVTDDLMGRLTREKRAQLIAGTIQPASHRTHDPQAGIEAGAQAILPLLAIVEPPPVIRSDEGAHQATNQADAQPSDMVLYVIIAILVIALALLLWRLLSRRRMTIVIDGEAVEAVGEIVVENADVLSDVARAAGDAASSAAEIGGAAVSAAGDAVSGAFEAAGDAASGFFDD